MGEERPTLQGAAAASGSASGLNQGSKAKKGNANNEHRRVPNPSSQHHRGGGNGGGGGGGGPPRSSSKKRSNGLSAASAPFAGDGAPKKEGPTRGRSKKDRLSIAEEAAAPLSAGGHCFICTEEMDCRAIGDCSHETCHRCNLKLRALYKNNPCPLCKVALSFFDCCRTAVLNSRA